MAEYDFIKMEKKLAKYLDEDRYAHTMGVMYTCAALAMVHGCDLIQDIHSKGIYRPVPEGWILFQKKLEENADVICIGNSGFSCGTRFNGTKEIPAKWRQGFQNITKPQGIFNVSLFVVGDFFIHEKFSFSK